MPINLSYLDKDGKVPAMYILSPHKSSDVTQWKVGRTVNLKNRMNQYILCFPKGFFIYGILIIKNTSPKKQLIERTKKLEQIFFIYLKELYEDDVMTVLQSDLTMCSQAKSSHKLGEKVRIKSEWITGISLSELKYAIHEFAKKATIKLITQAFTYDQIKEPYIHKFNVDGEEIDVQKVKDDKDEWIVPVKPVYQPKSTRTRQIKPNPLYKDFVQIK